MNKVTKFLFFVFAASILASSVTYSMNDGGMHDSIEEVDFKFVKKFIAKATVFSFVNTVTLLSSGMGKILIIICNNNVLLGSLFTVISATGVFLFKFYRDRQLRRIDENVNEIKETVTKNGEKLTNIESDVTQIMDDVNDGKNKVSEVNDTVNRIEHEQAQQAATLSGHGNQLQVVSDQVTNLQEQLDKNNKDTQQGFSNINNALEQNEKKQGASNREIKQQFDEVKNNQNEIKNKLESSLTSIEDEIAVIKIGFQGNTNNMNEMNTKFNRASLKLSDLQNGMSTIQAEIKKQFPKLAEDMKNKYKILQDEIKQLQQLFEKQIDGLNEKVEQGGLILRNGQYNINNMLSRLLLYQETGDIPLSWSDPNSVVFSKDTNMVRYRTCYVQGYHPYGVNVEGLFSIQNTLAIKGEDNEN